MGKETTSTVYQNTIPQALMPYATQLMGRAQSLTGNASSYVPYTQQQVAGYNPLQQLAFQNLYQMQGSPAITQATGLTGLAALNARSLPDYQAADYSRARYIDPNAQVGTYDLRNFRMEAPDDVQGYNYNRYAMQAAPDVYAPDLQYYSMLAPQQVNPEQYTQARMSDYMSPYMEEVLKRERLGAVEDYANSLPQLASVTTQVGGLGGTRQALLQSQKDRELRDRLADIRARGYQGAFQNAQQMFDAQRQAQMQADLANQQASMGTRSQNLQARLGVQELGAQQAMQAALANQQALQQARMQNLQARLGVQESEAQQNMQAQLANQQALMNTRMQNLQSLQNTQQLGSQQYMQAALANQQQAMREAEMRMQAQQLAEQSRQFGVGYGLQGLQAQLQAAQQLAQLGGQDFQQQQSINQALLQAGQLMQTPEQKAYEAQFRNFTQAQQYPYQQLAFMSDILRGVPTYQSIASTYGGSPSTMGQLAGLGIGLGSLVG